jgi:hypothetical protein
MRRGHFFKLLQHVVQTTRRKIRDASQRFQPAGNFIERLEGVIPGQLAQHLAQFARIGQRMLRFLREQSAQIGYLIEHVSSVKQFIFLQSKPISADQP